jgi:hypothetical protein
VTSLTITASSIAEPSTTPDANIAEVRSRCQITNGFAHAHLKEASHGRTAAGNQSHRSR